MKKNILVKIIFITLIFIVLSSLIMNVQASFDPDKYNVTIATKEEAKPVYTMGEKLFGSLKNIATVVAILTIAVIGLKYIFGSVEQKAEYKATLIPWFVGAVLVVMITGFLGIIEQLAKQI